MDSLKTKVEEFATIAKGLPENLQVVCFELLLEHHLESLGTAKPVGREKDSGELRDEPDVAKTVEESAGSQDDLAPRDLHMKVRKFLEKYFLSVDQLNNLFYKESGKILPLYEDLKTTRMSEGQVRIALLQSLTNALTTGEFSSQVEEIRQECTDRKCYDINNFTANFKNNKELFDFVTYTKSTKALRLSEAGRKELAQVIKELQ